VVFTRAKVAEKSAQSVTIRQLIAEFAIDAAPPGLLMPFKRSGDNAKSS
jgi:hypothetical protein